MKVFETICGEQQGQGFRWTGVRTAQPLANHRPQIFGRWFLSSENLVTSIGQQFPKRLALGRRSAAIDPLEDDQLAIHHSR